MEVGQLTARLKLNTQEFQRGLQQAQQNFQQTSEKLRKRADNLKNIGKKMTAGVTGAMAGLTATLGKVTLDAAQYADQIDKMSVRTGLATDTLQELKYVTGQLGVSFDVLEGATTTLGRRLVKAEEGSKNYARAVKKLNLNVRKSNGEMRSMDELFPEVIKKLSEMENETERNAIATELFSKGTAQQLIPMLDAGGETIEQLTEKARDMGVVMSKDGIEAGVAYADAMDTLKSSLAGAARQIGTELMPVITKDLIPAIENNIVPMLEELGKKIGSVIEWFSSLSPIAQKVIISIAGITAAIGPLFVVVGSLISAFTTVAPVVAAAGAAITGISLPVMIAVAAIGGLVAAGVAIYKNWETIKEQAKKIWGSIKERLLNVWGNIKKNASEIWTGITEFLRENGKKILLIAVGPAGWAVLLGTEIAKNWNVIKRVTEMVWGNIRKYLAGLWSNIKNIAGSFLTTLKTNITSSWSSIKTTTISIWNNIKNAVISKLQELKTNAVTRLEQLWNYIKSIPSQAVAWGKDIVEGLWQGISNLGNWLYDKVNKFVTDNVVGTVKSVLGIASPSQVMREFGISSVEGLSQGMQESRGSLRATMEDVSNEVTGGVSGLPNKMKEVGKQAGQKLGDELLSQINNLSDEIRERVIDNPSFRRAVGGSSGGSSSGGGSSDNDSNSIPLDEARRIERESGGLTDEQRERINNNPSYRGLTDEQRERINNNPSYTGPGLAAGGIVPGGKPKMFTLGDAPYAEAVLPLPQIKPLMTNALHGAIAKMSDRNVTNNSNIYIINRGTVVGRNGMEEFADSVGNHLSKKFGLSVGGSW